MSEQIEKDYNNSEKKIFYPKLNLTYMYVKLWSLNITKIKLLSISKNFFGLCRRMDGPTKKYVNIHQPPETADIYYQI